MKTLLLNCLLIVILLVSCSSPSDSTNESPSDSYTPEQSKIIGTPNNIGNFEVAQNDFPKKMNWNDAKKACADLGKGWRLPTKNELNLMYENKDKIGDFANTLYWSSTESDDGSAWLQECMVEGGQLAYEKYYANSVRAVRSLSPSESPKESPSESPLSEESKIIGTPTKIIGTPNNIGNFEVAQNDFPRKMRWKNAVKACEGLGNGWRLPTKDEQKLMYENTDIINGLVTWVNESYWSSTRYDSHFHTPIMWIMDFSSGKQNNKRNIDKLHLVRAVRSL